MAATALGDRTENGHINATARAVHEMRMRRGFVWCHIFSYLILLLAVSRGSLSVPQSIQCLMLLSDQIEEAPPALHLSVLTFYHGSESNLK